MSKGVGLGLRIRVRVRIRVRDSWLPERELQLLPDRVGGLGFELGFRLRVRVKVWVSIMKRPEENRRHKLRREEKITEQKRR